MEDHKVSCIIPAYNAEKTLPVLLDSVVNQVYENLEIIVVNDGSTDGTWDVIQEWAAKDSRIVPVNKENGGVSSARNAGLDIATGDFICFFDADDSVYPKTVKMHVRRMVKEGIIMSVGEVLAVHMNEEHVIKATERLGQHGMIQKYNKSLNWSMSVWNKCFRRDLIEKAHLRFNGTRHGEDGVFCFRYFHLNEGNAGGIPALVYRYVKKSFTDEVSLSKRIDIGAIESIKSNMAEIIGIVDERIEKDKAELASGSLDISEEEKEKRLQIIDEYRSNLFRRFTNSTVLNVYYRYVWNTADGVLDILQELYKEYMSNMLDEDRETIYSTHSDLRLGDRLMTMEELANDPILTVAISDSVPADKVESLVHGYYNQNLPAFEILIGKKAAEHVSNKLGKRLNFHVIENSPDGSFKKAALDAAKGKYIIFNDEYIVPSTSTILEEYPILEEQNLDFVTASMLELKDNEVRDLKAYSIYSGKKKADGVKPEDMKIVDSTLWGNKVFRVESLRSSSTFSQSAEKSDCLKKLYKELSSTLYSDNAFISSLTDDDLVGRLGMMDRFSIGRKLK